MSASLWYSHLTTVIVLAAATLRNHEGWKDHHTSSRVHHFFFDEFGKWMRGSVGCIIVLFCTSVNCNAKIVIIIMQYCITIPQDDPSTNKNFERREERKKKRVEIEMVRNWLCLSSFVVSSARGFSSTSSGSGLATMASATSTSSPFKVALCQLLCGEDKAANIRTAEDAISTAAQRGADLIVLPECWNCPYDVKQFNNYAEEVPKRASDLDPEQHQTTYAMSQAASRAKRHLVAGSIPERLGANLYNTCVTFSPDGEIIGIHRKIHLFDIDVPGKISFRESETLSPGSSVTVMDTPLCRIGVGICYDIRFPELSMVMRSQGCELLLFPGAFNMVTGPAHWELLQRARAVDNQCYVCTVSPARNPNSGYQAWGHSTATNPWGEVIATTGHENDIVIAEIDLNKVGEVRDSIPVGKQKRHDLYELVVPKKPNIL
jgi:omega-amidase